MVEVVRDETVERSIFRIAETLTSDVTIQEKLVRAMCAHLTQLRDTFPSQSTGWYLKNCETRARAYLRQPEVAPCAPRIISESPSSANGSGWLPELQNKEFRARLTPRLTEKQQQVLALFMDAKMGVREAGRHLGVSHVAVIKHRKKIERVVHMLLPTSTG